MNKTLFYALMVIVASSSYGILSTIVKLAMQAGYTSSEAISSQYIFGFLFVFLLFLFFDRKMPTLSLKGFAIIVLGGLLTATTGIVYGQSLNYLPASLAVVMLFQFTWIGLFINCAFQRRLPNRTEVISLVFLFVGTLLAAGVLDVDLSSIPLKGWVLGLLSAVSFACFIQLNSVQVKGVTTLGRTLIVSITAVLLVSVVSTPEIVWNGQITAGLWSYGLVLGLFGLVLPILLLSIAVPKVGGGLASILSAMELPVAICVSVIFLPETLTWIQVVGIIIVLIGMTLPSYFAMRKDKKSV